MHVVRFGAFTIYLLELVDRNTERNVEAGMKANQIQCYHTLRSSFMIITLIFIYVLISV